MSPRRRTLLYVILLLLSFPPAVAPAMEIPIAALRSDRDKDGITDILEEHLLLNPDNADSDGDGIDDAAIRCPM